MEAFPGGNEVHHGKRKGRSSSRTDVNPEVTKTAVYIKNLFMVGSLNNLYVIQLRNIRSCFQNLNLQIRRQHFLRKYDIITQDIFHYPLARVYYICYSSLLNMIFKYLTYFIFFLQKIVRGELTVNKSIMHNDREWHQNHSCKPFYTCAVDTNNVKKVLEGCRTLIIRKHLERFGII